MFTSVEQGFEKIHSSVQRLTPAYTQSMSNLQQQALTAWKNFVCSGISIQRQYAEKAGMKTETVEVTSQIIQRMAEEAARSFEVQGTMVRAFLDASEQNLKKFNDHTTMYTEWQKRFADYYLHNWNNNLQKNK